MPDQQTILMIVFVIGQMFVALTVVVNFIPSGDGMHDVSFRVINTALLTLIAYCIFIVYAVLLNA